VLHSCYMQKIQNDHENDYKPLDLSYKNAYKGCYKNDYEMYYKNAYKGFLP